ncbi:MAG TPA: nitrous oxide reductase accessory protein NosL [Roseiarcus sp.]|nr:nitrous oxide reductase accessory protein NosL [Roseiarcus sp.]
MRRRELLLGLVLLAACKRDDANAEAPRPREPTDASVAQFCGMALTEHAGPKGQIFIRGLRDPYWFATVRDAFAFVLLQEMPKAISAIYVNDMARAKNWDQPEQGMWVEAHEASYVIESRRHSGMDTNETIPFSDAAAAKRFAAANGGRVVSFDDMPRDYILVATSGEP